MTCSSPFAYVVNLGTIEYPYTFSGKNTLTIPGYTTPSVTTTPKIFHAGHIQWGTCQTCTGCPKTQCGSCKACHWTGWRNTVLDCGWNSCNCRTWWDSNCICTPNNHCNVGWVAKYWTDGPPITIPGIQVFPNLSAEFDFEVDMAFTAGVNFVFSVTGAAPVAVAGAIIKDAKLDMHLKANDTDILDLSFDSDQLGLHDVELQALSNGTLEGIVPLTSLSNPDPLDFAGFYFEVTLASNLLFCIPPEPSAINIQFTITYTVTKDDKQITSQTLAVAIPLLIPE